MENKVSKNKQVHYDRHWNREGGKLENATQLSDEDKLKGVTRCASRVTGSCLSVGSRFYNLSATKQRPWKVQLPAYKFKVTQSKYFLDYVALTLPWEYSLSLSGSYTINIYPASSLPHLQRHPRALNKLHYWNRLIRPPSLEFTLSMNFSLDPLGSSYPVLSRSYT